MMKKEGPGRVAELRSMDRAHREAPIRVGNRGRFAVAGVNKACPCKSGRRFKDCCMGKGNR